MECGYKSLPPWPQEVSLNQPPSSLGGGWAEEDARAGGLGSFLAPRRGRFRKAEEELPWIRQWSAIYEAILSCSGEADWRLAQKPRDIVMERM